MLSFCCDNTICRRENKHANKNSSIKRNEQNEITKVEIDVNECNKQRNQFSFVYSQSLNKTEEIAPSAPLNPPFPQFHIDDKLLRAMKTSEEKWLSQKTERERKEYGKKLLRVIHLWKNRSLGKSYYAWTSYVYERKMIRKYANKIYIRRKLSVFLSWINFVERHKTLKLVNEVFSPEKTNNDDVFLLDFNSKHFPIPINRLKECIYNLYHRFDIDGNGYLDIHEMKNLFHIIEKSSEVLNSLTDEEITDVFLTFDKDHDGKLDRSEFCTWILSGLSRSIEKRIAYSKTSVLANKLNHFLNGIVSYIKVEDKANKRIAQLRARLTKKKNFLDNSLPDMYSGLGSPRNQLNRSDCI